MRYVLLGLLYIIALLPFPILYGMSSFLSFLLRMLIRYRKEIINTNLQQAFPEKNKSELRGIQKNFYRNYADVFFESIKLLLISEKKIFQMIAIRKNKALESLQHEDAGAIILTGHRGNFELAGQFLSLQLPHPFYGAYKPFKSKVFEFLWYKIRHNFKMKYIPAKQVSRFLLKHRNEGHYLAFLNDQSPTYGDQHCWIDFLNKEALFFTGPEKLAAKLQLPVYFMDMIRRKRGHYEIIVENLEATAEENGLTKAYAKKLEQAIKSNPDGWLWSHRRWKRERKEIS
jgi:KDO2-lipid IV(A) lauroyltransferase